MNMFELKSALIYSIINKRMIFYFQRRSQRALEGQCK